MTTTIVFCLIITFFLAMATASTVSSRLEQMAHEQGCHWEDERTTWFITSIPSGDYVCEGKP